MTDQPSSLLLNCLGFIACGLVLCTFAMTSMRPLRMVAMASNLSFISYAWMMNLWPILALHSILLPLNAFRLIQMDRPDAPGRAAARDGAARVAQRTRA